MAATTWLLMVSTTLAQSEKKVWRLAWLGEGVAARGPAAYPGVIVDALQELGYINGQNLTIEFRSAGTQYELLPALAAELVQLKPDVMVATSTQALIALQRATLTIPIVMVLPGDPVGVGLVKSLAHPGGNITGTSLMMPRSGESGCKYSKK